MLKKGWADKTLLKYWKEHKDRQPALTKEQARKLKEQNAGTDMTPQLPKGKKN